MTSANTKPKPIFKLIIAMLLAVTHLIAGFGLLLVASWFIAACSIAGLGFNYMLPAVVIRALALIRIASGYANMLAGHSHLLETLATIRMGIFSGVENKVWALREQSLDAFNRQSEELASVWISWVGQTAGMLFSLLILNLVCWLLLPQLGIIAVILAIPFGMLYLSLLVSLLFVSKQRMISEQIVHFKVVQYVETTPIWHLLDDFGNSRPSSNILKKWERRMQSRFRLASLLFFISCIALLTAVFGVYSEQFTGNTLFIVLPIALLSVNDWLTPGFANQKYLLRYMNAKEGVTKISGNSKQVSPIEHEVTQLELTEFKPCDTAMSAISAAFTPNSINVVVGSSGTGKSRLLQGIAGLLAFDGLRVIKNGINTLEYKTSNHGRLADALYIEQLPYILSDTLRANLLVANELASDRYLFDILGKVGLSYLVNLDEWLGENGRLLSGGEKKRIGLARALLCESNLILLDEPFEALDAENVERVARLINTLSNEKIIVLATHILPESLRYEQVISVEKSAIGREGVWAPCFV